jgi:hypothetical protein
MQNQRPSVTQFPLASSITTACFTCIIATATLNNKNIQLEFYADYLQLKYYVSFFDHEIQELKPHLIQIPRKPLTRLVADYSASLPTQAR